MAALLFSLALRYAGSGRDQGEGAGGGRRAPRRKGGWDGVWGSPLHIASWRRQGRDTKLIDRVTAEERHRLDLGEVMDSHPAPSLFQSKDITKGDHLMRVKRVLWATVLTVSLFLQTAPSSLAFTITQIGTSGGNPGGLPVYNVTGLVQGDSYSVLWNHVTQGQTLSAQATITIVGLTATSAQVSVTLENTSTIGRMTIFGISVGNFTPPPGTGVPGNFLDAFDATPSEIALGFPGLQNFVDVCATSGLTCAGGASGGIVFGNSDSFTFALNRTSGSTLTLDGFGVKVQGGPSGASFELPGTPGPVVPVELQEFSVE